MRGSFSWISIYLSLIRGMVGPFRGFRVSRAGKLVKVREPQAQPRLYVPPSRYRSDLLPPCIWTTIIAHRPAQSKWCFPLRKLLRRGRSTLGALAPRLNDAFGNSHILIPTSLPGLFAQLSSDIAFCLGRCTFQRPGRWPHYDPRSKFWMLGRSEVLHILMISTRTYVYHSG